MNKYYLLAATAALALAGCSSENDMTGGISTPPSDQQTPVTFSSYVGKTANTRAVSGTTGNMTASTLATPGFGVIAYYTGNTNFSTWKETAANKPNFMYNEKIVSANNGVDWDYAVAANKKYWPNDISTTGGGSVDTQTSPATGTGTGGKLSFFAYGPYVEVDVDNATDSERGKTKTTSADKGIMALSSNKVNGDPTVTYKIDVTGAEVVDLLWGTLGSTDDNVLGTSQSDASAQTAKTLSGGLAPVNIDLTKQKTDGKVAFNFKHALARVGGIGTSAGLQVQLDIDQSSTPFISGGTKDDNTKVTIKSITIKTPNTEEKKINIEGILDLGTGLWSAMASPVKGQVTHTISNAAATPTTNQIKTGLAEPTTTVDEWSDLNSINGVTTSPQNVYEAENAPFYIIPIAGTNPELTFTIDYFVRTKDVNLDAGYSEVEQKITKTIQLDLNGSTDGVGTYQANKRYNIVMHLGLTSVKFTATVADWETTNNSGTEFNGDVHLPVNVVTTPTP